MLTFLISGEGCLNRWLLVEKFCHTCPMCHALLKTFFWWTLLDMPCCTTILIINKRSFLPYKCVFLLTYLISGEGWLNRWLFVERFSHTCPMGHAVLKTYLYKVRSIIYRGNYRILWKYNNCIFIIRFIIYVCRVKRWGNNDISEIFYNFIYSYVYLN